MSLKVLGQYTEPQFAPRGIAIGVWVHVWMVIFTNEQVLLQKVVTATLAI